MTSIRERVATRYAAASSRDQTLFLAKLADRMTLVGRDTYGGQYGVADAAGLRACNEAQHRILSQLVHLLANHEHRYPDDVFANILVDQFEILKLDPEKMMEFLD